jgi:hypothetical protein
LSNGLYFLLIPGLALVVLAGAVALATFAMVQGPFQETTRRGLFSLAAVVVLLGLLFWSALRLDQLHLPPPGLR